MPDEISALQGSAARLRRLAEPLTPAQLRLPAYPSDWSIADVLSHLGSGAVILLDRLTAALAGTEQADDFAPSVWDEWDAKSPEAKAADGLAADRTLVERLVSFTDDERARVHVSVGPVQLDFVRYIALRVNEHSLHTWDIEVALDPGAVLPAETAAIVVDNLELITRFVGKPSGLVHDVRIHTTEPARDFVLALGAESVALSAAENTGSYDLELPAEALVRLVYGRLDPEHTPAVSGDADLDELRRVFPGV